MHDAQRFKTAGELREAGKGTSKPTNARMAVIIDKADHTALKRAALELDTTAAEITRVLIREWLDKRSRE